MAELETRVAALVERQRDRGNDGPGDDLDRLAEDLGVVLPVGLRSLWSSPPIALQDRLYRPYAEPEDPMSLSAAFDELATSYWQPPADLLPITYVDDRSLACVVCRPRGESSPVPNEGYVVRWHLDEIPREFQEAIIDIDSCLYAASLEEEMAAWDTGYQQMAKLAISYQQKFVEMGIVPKAKDLRPFQLACQNVIVGLAALQYEQRTDAHAVRCWQTCEVPHVATNEANRALAALLLCDAFQAGGTMEINFERHPEGQVPASLRRYGRTLGLELGQDFEVRGGKPVAISPAEARDLFRAVTPVSKGLREATERAVESGLISPERLCYSLLYPIWSAVELEFLLRCSPRAESILRGGADVEDRGARLAELEVARAAAMVGMLFRRLDSKDTAGRYAATGEARAFEDSSRGVRWQVSERHAAVHFSHLADGAAPWQLKHDQVVVEAGRLTVVPRPHPLPLDESVLDSLRSLGSVALLVPNGATVPEGVPALICPDRLSDLDAAVERRLQTSRVVRA